MNAFLSARILVRTEAGSSFCSDVQSVSSDTLSMVLNVVTDKGRCVAASVLRAPDASSTRASLRLRARWSSAQKAVPSVNNARRAMFPCFCS